jgi:hypothetical protein
MFPKLVETQRRDVTTIDLQKKTPFPNPALTLFLQ